MESSIDLSEAVVVVPPGLSGPERKAVAMLVDEVEKRTWVRWEVSTEPAASQRPAVVVGPASALEAWLSLGEEPVGDEGARAAEGYRIRTVHGQDGSLLLVLGNDARGVLYGVGHLLRVLRMNRGSIVLPGDLNVETAPRCALRGHQLGYRDKTNSYCGWDLGQWEQYIRELAIFGANAIELIPPRSDDRLDSVHFQRPPLDMMAGMSQLADDYGLDVWIWYPAMDEDYGEPEVVAFALEEWGQVFQRLPRVDAVFVPGGDPGWTRPRHLMALLEKQTANLQRYHPEGQMWVSPQGFGREWMDEFLDILRLGDAGWLTGVVHGPWVHVSLEAFRRLVPSQYPIRNYPDITHSLSCQHPVPDWDVAYALTEGRESINPRPLAQAAILKHALTHTAGFLTYSEGCHDDVNKCIWSALGWDPERAVIDVLREYCRVYIGDRYADDYAQGLLALERNWAGPLACNAGVYTTLQQFQDMEAAASPHDLKNWRFQQGLYRAYYDAYTRSRLLYETGLEEQAMDQLRQAADVGSLAALDRAERILDQAVTQRIADGWRTRIYQLAEALFQSIHMQLSVPLYGGQEEVRGANLDGIDYPLNDRPWLVARISELRRLDVEEDRLTGIRAIVQWTNPGPGGAYDDLKNSPPQPHLVRGPAFEEDPAFLHSPLRQFPYRKDPRPLRRSWRTYTGSLGDAPFEMHYDDLDPKAAYELRIVYSDANPEIPVRLEANEGIEVHPYVLKADPRRPVAFAIPREATRSGALTLRWFREPGHGRAGRGCEVSEIWLVKTAEQTA